MPNISWMSFKSFNNQEVEGLNALFYEEEVFRALSNLNKDKAVVLDGFPMAFWQFSWDFLKYDVLGPFREFYHQQKFQKCLNAMFLC